MSNPLKISYNGNDFLLDVAEGKLVSLNAIYEIAGSPVNQEAWRWLDTEQSKQFIESAMNNYNLAKNEDYKSQAW